MRATNKIDLWGKSIETIKSPMNYTGGKHKLLPQLLPLFPQEVDTFVDLFCGGANVGINASSKRLMLNDNLLYLIDLYQSFASTPLEEILSYIREQIKRYNLSISHEKGYKDLRQHYNTERNPLDLFVLLAYSFNHQIRFNTAHEFNTPFGRNRSSYNSRMEQNLIDFVEALQSKELVFSALNFEQVDLTHLGAKDFLYCDPPYLISTGTYNDGKRGFTGWSIEQETLLYSVLDDFALRGRFALSNVLEHKGKTNDMLHIWAKERGYYITPLSHHYANSSYHTHNRDKNSTQEILISNYDPSQL